MPLKHASLLLGCQVTGKGGDGGRGEPHPPLREHQAEGMNTESHLINEH